jgi:hypothetical protein
MSELEGYASEQTATIYSHRQPTARLLGVKFGDMAKVIKKIRRNSALAVELWNTGIFEARHIACNVIDPPDVTEAQVDVWVAQIDFPLLADSLAEVVAQTPFPPKSGANGPPARMNSCAALGIRSCICPRVISRIPSPTRNSWSICGQLKRRSTDRPIGRAR